MPVMSAIEAAFCRSGPWRRFSRQVVLPWALDGVRLRGDVLEIGGGSGVMVDGAARTFPLATITFTDVDDAMVAMAATRLGTHTNVRVELADAAALPYPAESFDFVTSWLMLHHVIDWPAALGEASRVLRPGGVFIGYDLTDTKLARLTHRLDGSPHRIVAPEELIGGLSVAGFADVVMKLSLRDHIMRFLASKHGTTSSS